MSIAQPPPRTEGGSAALCPRSVLANRAAERLTALRGLSLPQRADNRHAGQSFLSSPVRSLNSVINASISSAWPWIRSQ